MSVMADLDISMQAGNYLSLTPHLVGIEAYETSQAELVYTVDSEWPSVFFYRTSGVFNVSGLIYGPGIPVTFKAATGSALFALIDKNLRCFGPAGYVALNDKNLISPNNVIQVAGQAAGTQAHGVARWRYGDLLPAAYNSNKAHSDTGYFRAPAGAWCLINVVKRGSVTALEVRYTISGTTYRLAADVVSSEVNPQLKLGQLVDGSGDAIAAESDGVWRINVTGSTSDSEIYIGIDR